MKRGFIFVGHKAPTDPDFSLNNLAGEGRLDLLCRCVNAALLLSHGTREDVTAHLVLRDEIVVRFESDEVRGLNPDERSIAGLVRAALEERTYYEVEASSGVYVAERSLEEVLEATDGETFVLHEDGGPASDVEPPERAVFVLSDHQDFTDDERGILNDHEAKHLSLGPQVLHADHATVVAHNWCDTEGYEEY